MRRARRFAFRRLRPLLAGFRRELGGLIDCFLPVNCAFCNTPLASSAQPAICSTCQRTLAENRPASCPRCALPYLDYGGSDHLCGDCQRQPPHYRTVCALGVYEGPLRQAIHRFKYQKDFTLATPLGHLLAAAVRQRGLLHADLILPVPLHPSRLRQRTFNQSLLLARILGKRSSTPVAGNLLRRLRPTPSQQGLSLEDRRHNLHQAFALHAPLNGESVLLVDDVMTSGATIAACTKALLKNGAQTVDVAILARAAKGL